MLHKGKPRIFDASVRASDHSRTSSTFTIGKNPHLTKKNKLHSKSTYFYRWGSKLNYVIPSVCALALLVGGIIAINPILNNVEKVSAEEGIAVTADDPSISIAFPTTGLPPGYNNALEQQTPALAGEVAYRTNIFQVTASHYKDYSVLISSMNGYGAELHGKENPTTTIGGVGPGIRPNDFKNNTWGYAVTSDMENNSEKSLAYNTVPNYSDGSKTIIQYSYAKESEWSIPRNYKLAFAAKIGGDSPSDHYIAKIALSVVGTPGEISELYSIDNMQDLTSTICKNSTVNSSKQLTDTRDGKQYWVTKLADGNCWMTQNLDYDVPGAEKVSTPYYWNRVSISNSKTQAYYDPGDYIYIPGPSGQNGDCSTPSSSTTATLAYCSEQVAEKTANSNLHYHVGNYYSWHAATAGSGASVTSGNASSSICPTGWKLPSNSTSDFEKLVAAYGWSLENNNAQQINGNKGAYNSPLYFIYTGRIMGNTTGWLQSVGNYGAYWSSTGAYANDEYNYVYVLYVSQIINPSLTNINWGRGGGSSIRCVFKP